MDADEIGDKMAKALAPLTDIAESLNLLTLLRLADEFYTKDERAELYKKYAALMAEDAKRFANLKAVQNAVQPDPGIGHDARVEKYGKEVAEGHLAPVQEALSSRRECIEAVSDFRNEHKVLERIFWAKDAAKDGRS